MPPYWPRKSNIDEADLLYFSDLSQVEQGEVIGYSLVVVSTEIIERAIFKNQLISSLITFLIICFGVIIGYFFTNIIIRPVRALMIANQKVAKGDFTIQVDRTSSDEVGLLTDSFNHMDNKIRVQQDELLDYSKNLEKKSKIEPLNWPKKKKNQINYSSIFYGIDCRSLKKRKKPLPIVTMK